MGEINSTEHYDYEICYNNNTSTSSVTASIEFSFGTVGNVIALVLLWISRHEHHWSSFYKLFTALAITDFLGISLTYPFVFHRYASKFTWCYSKALCEFVSFMVVCAHLSEALLICAMSADRFLHLKYPADYKTSGKHYILILVAILIVSTSIAQALVSVYKF
jgi:prostaglandin E receptor 4